MFLIWLNSAVKFTPNLGAIIILLAKYLFASGFDMFLAQII